MKDLLKAYENRAPEIVFAWQDSETEARGWVVINSLRGGAAGGGTRMRPGLDQREVESLAKTMEVKFTVSGPYIGGARDSSNRPRHPRHPACRFHLGAQPRGQLHTGAVTAGGRGPRPTHHHSPRGRGGRSMRRASGGDRGEGAGPWDACSAT